MRTNAFVRIDVINEKRRWWYDYPEFEGAIFETNEFDDKYELIFTEFNLRAMIKAYPDVSEKTAKHRLRNLSNIGCYISTRDCSLASNNSYYAPLLTKELEV